MRFLIFIFKFNFHKIFLTSVLEVFSFSINQLHQGVVEEFVELITVPTCESLAAVIALVVYDSSRRTNVNFLQNGAREYFVASLAGCR